MDFSINGAPAIKGCSFVNGGVWDSSNNLVENDARELGKRYQAELPPIYKGNTTMYIALDKKSYERDYILTTVIKESGEKDRIFQKTLWHDDCPKSKEYLTWIVERAEAKRNQKLRKGYTEVQGEQGYEEPMRLRDWVDVPRDKGTYIIQPKLNGVRCIAHPDGRLVSRGNKEFQQEHLSNAVVSLGLSYPLDCEMYTHGRAFEDISGAARRGNTDWLQLHIFDAVTSKIFEHRYSKLMDLDLKDPLHLVPAAVIDFKDTQSINPMLNEVVLQGYEGLVLKTPGNLWRTERSGSAWKYKPVYDDEFEIVSVDSDSLPEGECIKFVCITKAGHLFEVVPSWSRAKRVEAMQYAEDFVHKMLTVEYRGFSKDTRIPVHAVGKEIRDYE